MLHFVDADRAAAVAAPLDAPGGEPSATRTGAPLVTCLMCAYNYARYVREALDSALAQTYPNVEVLVVDDGSTDETPQILESYGDRIRVVRQQNAGLNGATARGIAEARGELVALLDADDVWRPDKLRRQVDLLLSRPEVGLVFSDMETMDAGGEPLAPSYFAAHRLTPPRGHALGAFLQENYAPAPTIVFRRELADHVLPVAAEASFQDWWLALRIAEVAELDFVDEPLVRYRLHGDNMASGAGGERWLANVRKDNRFRRWMLANLDLSSATQEDLRRAWARFEQHTAIVASHAGHDLAAEVALQGRDREASGTLLTRGAPLAALAADPLDPAAREAFQAGTSATAERIAWAEQRFEAGDVGLAAEALHAVATTAEDDELAARANGDLAVIALTLGDAEGCRRAAAGALRRNPQSAEALEVLGRCAETAGDVVQAAHWYMRATAAAPRDAGVWRARAAIEHQRARWPQAVEAYRMAAALAPLPDEDAAKLRAAEGELAAKPAEAPGGAPGRVLICADYFFPSVGGTERLTEGVGVALQELGWSVDVACRALPERAARSHRGMSIHEVHHQPADELKAIVDNGGYDAVLAFSDPYAWPVASALRLPQDGPRTVVVPCINPGNEGRLRGSEADLDAWRAGLQRGDVVVHSSRGGLDARLNRDLDVAGVYVPNATEVATPLAGVRSRFGLAEDTPLLVCVANLYPGKGHVELLERLAGHAGDWRLLLIGAPADAAHAQRVAGLAGRDARVVLAGGQPPEVVAGALEAADVLLLPSREEATPLSLLEAMSRGVPWIATPRCGAALEWAGGLVLPVDDFPAGIDRLLEHPAERERLGAAGRAHWNTCFSCEVVARRYDALLRGAALLPDLPPPADGEAATEEVRAAVYHRLLHPPAPDRPTTPMPATPATPYVPDYFDALQRGSHRSAQAILPMVFEAVGPASVLDVGCGIGTWLAAARELGVDDVAGVDGDYVDRDRLLIPAEAFTAANLEVRLDLGRRFDLVTTLEVAEHLDPAAADTFVASLARHGDVVLFSAAIPGQGGEHHVNEQWPEYWASRFAAHGYVATDPLRMRCWLDPAVEPWYAQNVLVFVHGDRLADFPGLAAAAVPGGVPLPLVHPRIFGYAVERAAEGAGGPPDLDSSDSSDASDGTDASDASDASDAALGAFVTVAHADEAAADPEILAAYAARFTAYDDATLVLYAPDGDAERVAAGLSPALAAAGMDRDGGPDAMLLCVPAAKGDQALAERADVVLSRRARHAALASKMHAGPAAMPLVRALAVGELPRPARADGLAAALLEAVVVAAGGPDLEDNIDLIRFPNGQGAPDLNQAPALLAAQLRAAPSLEPLWSRLDSASREVLVALLAYKVLGYPKVRMPVGSFRGLREMADRIHEQMLVEQATGRIDFLDWQLDRYDLAALDMPIQLHSHPWLIINEFMLEQYRAPAPFDVAVRPGDVVIDGGGCWGETALHFAHLAGPEGRVESFEFDPRNLATLESNLALNPALAERVRVHRHALWHTAGERLSFDSNGPGTRIGSGDGGVETSSIDALVASGEVERIDFVKLDVEGSELAVLEGAASALRRFRPRLAIAAYHRDDDLVALPAFLENLGVGYRFSLGHYTMAVEETVLFAWCDGEA